MRLERERQSGGHEFWKLYAVANKLLQMRTNYRCEQTADANWYKTEGAIAPRLKLRLGQNSYGECLSGNTKKLQKSYKSYEELVNSYEEFVNS